MTITHICPECGRAVSNEVFGTIECSHCKARFDTMTGRKIPRYSDICACAAAEKKPEPAMSIEAQDFEAEKAERLLSETKEGS